MHSVLMQPDRICISSDEFIDVDAINSLWSPNSHLFAIRKYKHELPFPFLFRGLLSRCELLLFRHFAMILNRPNAELSGPHRRRQDDARSPILDTYYSDFQSRQRQLWSKFGARLELLESVTCRPKEISASQPFFRLSISCFTRSISSRLASFVPHRGALLWVASAAARMRASAAS